MCKKEAKLDTFYSEADLEKTFWNRKRTFVDMARGAQTLSRPTVKPPSFGAVGNPRLKTQAANTPSATTFKNPLLGIEVNLMRNILENDVRHKPTSKRKLKILFNAIEDVAAVDQEFGPILRDVAEMLRPPEVPAIFCRTAVFCDLNQSMTKYKDLARRTREQAKRIENLRAQIAQIQKETEETAEETEKIKEKIFKESDHFARERSIAHKISNLEEQYQACFIKSKPPELPPEIEALIADNTRLRREMIVKRQELELTNQMSKRMRLMDDHPPP